MADDVKMSAGAAEPVIEHFRDLAAEFENTRWKPWGQANGIDAACGELSSSVEDGTDAYHLAWRVTLDTCSEAAALIAGNTNVFDLDLHRLDEDLSHVPTI